MNPFSQLIGLSVLIHLTIILLKKWRIMGVSFHRAPFQTLSLYIMCTTLAITIITLAGGAATAVVTAGFRDKYSNAKLVASVMNRFQEPEHAEPEEAHPPEEGPLVIVPDSSTGDSLAVAMQPAPPCDTHPLQLVGVSIVDCLYARRQSVSFSYRAALAREHGIDFYSGTAKQNRQLLDRLREEEFDIKEPCVNQNIEGTL